MANADRNERVLLWCAFHVLCDVTEKLLRHSPEARMVPRQRAVGRLHNDIHGMPDLYESGANTAAITYKNRESRNATPNGETYYPTVNYLPP